jgi:hypothetical protein
MTRMWRAAGLVCALLLCLASNSTEGGDRANGGCPEDEVCSPDTPDGLYFASPAVGDSDLGQLDEPGAIAASGTRTIEAFRDDDATQPFSGFQAVVSNDAVLAVEGTDGSQTVVRGVAAGDAYLRLVDAASGELYDRVSLRVAPVASVAIVPLGLDVVGDKQLHEATSPPPVVFHTVRAHGRFAVALFAEDGERLVDESMTLDTPAGFQRDGDQWDRIEQNGSLPAGTYNVGVGLGDGISRTKAIELVSTVDDIVWVAGMAASEQASPDAGVVKDDTARFCFRAEKGNAAVVGAPLAYTVTSGLEVSGTPGACVNLVGKSTGQNTLTVSSGDVSVPFVVQVH